MSRSVQEQLDRLMRTAARRQEALPRRTASVRNMHSLLRTPQGQAAGQAMLPALWPAALQLLQDSQADMRQTAAPVVGFLGALAARPGRPAGVSPNLLFDWAMPVLAGQGIGGWKHLDVGVQCWVLVALKEGLAAVDIPVLHQHALAVLTLCHSLLRSEGTSVHLIAPVLGLVSEAARHLPSLRTIFRGIVDLLVAWWLEPKLNDIVRPLLARTLESVKQGWQHDPGLGNVLLTRLLQDLQVVTSDKSGVSAEGQKRFMRLCSCIEAIVSGCGHHVGVGLPGLLGQWIEGMHRGYNRLYALGKYSPVQASSALEQLCTYIQHAITAALAQGQPSTPSTSTQAPHTPPSQPPTPAATAQQQQEQATAQLVLPETPSQTPPPPIQAVISPIMDFILAAATSASQGMQASAVLRLLKLAQALVDAMQQQRCKAGAGQVEMLMGSDSAVGKLRADSDSQITEAYAALQALLLAASSTRAAATQHVIKHLLQTSKHLLDKPTSSHTAPVSNGAKASVAKANGGTGDGGGNSVIAHPGDRAGGGTHDQLVTIQSGLAALHEAVAAHEDAAVYLMVWQQLVHLAAPTGFLEVGSDVSLALLSLLHLTWQHTKSISTHELATLLIKLARHAAHTNTHKLVMDWAREAALQYLSPSPSPSAEGSSLSDSSPTTGSATQQPQQLTNGTQPTHLLCPDAYLEVLMRLCRVPETHTRLSAVQALSDLMHTGSHFLPHQLVATTDVACYLLTDSSELVSQASIQLLLCLAAPATHSMLSSTTSAAGHEPLWRRLYALQPQQIALQPEQLAELLQWLGQTSPLVVSQPSASGVASTSAGDEWLWRILKSCQPISAAVAFPMTSAAAAWYAIQEAAKHCTAVRMRTHLGNPSQTFAALEQLLQSMLARLSSTEPDPSQAVTDSAAPITHLYSVPAARSSSAGPLLEPAWMLLELMHALEKNMYCAYAGSCLRPSAFATAAVAFYKSNRKVCEDWFMRMRMLLLRTSAAANSSHLTLHHAFARLADLKAQLRHLQAAAAVEAAQQLQQQLQAQRQQAQLQEAREAQDALQLLETQLNSQLPTPPESAVTSAKAVNNTLDTNHSQASQRSAPSHQPHLRPHQSKPDSLDPESSTQQDSPARQPHSAGRASIGKGHADSAVPPALPPGSLFKPEGQKLERPAPVGLLAIQAEQEAEAARAAEAAAAKPSTRSGKGPFHGKSNQVAASVPDGSSQRGQSRVLQVKRQKPGQSPSAMPAPKVLPLTKASSGKVVVATPAPTPGKIKLMARPQAASEASAQQNHTQAKPDSTTSSQQPLTPSHARTARAQAARRLSIELQEVLRHAALAMLHNADADAVVGLHQYCQSTFSAVSQLANATRGEPTSRSPPADEGPSNGAEHSNDQHQFDWLHGVTLQASARHEEAAAVYSGLLLHPSKAKLLRPEGSAFLVDRCCEAYASVADWQGLQQWLQDLKGQEPASTGRDASWPLAPAQEHKYDALAAFDAGQLQEAQHAFDLSVWSDLKNDRGGVHAAEAAEATTLKALMQLHAPASAKQRAGRDKRLIRSMLQDSKDTLLQSLAVTAQTGLHNATAQLTALHCLTAVQESVPAPAAALPSVDAPPGFAPKTAEPITHPLFALSLWPFGDGCAQDLQPYQWPAQDPQPLLQLLRVHKVLASKGQQQLLLDAVQSAGASGNHLLADRLTADIASQDTQGVLSVKLQLLRLQHQHSTGGIDDASASGQLFNLLLPLLQTKAPSEQVELASLQAQAIVQLAHWWQASPSRHDGSNNGTFHANLGQRSEVLNSLKEIVQGGGSIQPYLPCGSPDQAICLAAAVKLTSGSASAWLAYADYLHSLCYPASSPNPPQAHAPPQAEAPASPTAADTLSSASHDSHPVENDQVKQQIATEMVKAYCAHLRLAAHSVGQAGVPEDHMPVLLKLLHLASEDHIVSDALHALKSESSTIPVLTWRAVVPQLFALLVHECADVWGLALELLQALQCVDPAAVLYPVLVESKRISKGQAAAKPGLQALMDSCQARQPQLVEQMVSMMTELEHMSVLWTEQWHIALLELQADIGTRVASLQQELKSITARAGLGVHEQTQVMRERYTTILAPAIYTVQQRLALHTADDAQTPQQKEFASKHLPALKQAAAAFANPTDDILLHPELTWSAFKAVSRAIAQQLSAREVQLTSLSPVLCQLTATSIPIPGLTPLHSLPLPHPQPPSPSSSQAEMSASGPYQISSAELVTVASFKPSVHVMSTKTRPKRIAMLGSDGQTYTFLLKGWEDLRLDERLMQLVRTFAVILRSDPDTARRQLLPCPLSVTPLGASMGLIQWVDHTMPLYGVYKAWQHRQLTDKADVQAQGEAAEHPVGKASAIHLPRATDAFYAKLLPALEAAGLPRTTPRKDWPLPLLKQILTDSMQETPRQLLARELWCGSGSASEWWGFQAGYTSSTAAMSMVGYMLGLGDRHLDNLLLDKHTGRVVHIDYNIVFDKGQQLRVPEIVPFRLTHTMQAALGAAGVEGPFRKGCEHIMRVVRGHSATLHNLLQSLLLDPLVAWTPDRQQAGNKRDADAAVALNLFYSRITEQQESCAAVLSSLAAALPGAVVGLQDYEAVHRVADETASAARAAHQQVLEAQASQAALASSTEALTLRLHQAQAALPRLLSELQSNQHVLQRHMRECQGWSDRHQYTVKALRDQLPAELMCPDSHWAADQAPVQLGLVSSLGASTIPSILQAALQASQQQVSIPPTLLHQAHSIDQQALQLLTQRGQGILAGLAGLQAYSAALRLVLGHAYADSSHHSQSAGAIKSGIAANDTEAIVESVRLMPHPSNPQDILISWHVLKALPFSLVFASQHLDQQLTHARTHRQPLMLASADAKAELVDSLGRLEDDARTDGIVAAAVRTCLSAAANDLKGLDTETAMPKAAQCIHGLSQLLDLLEQQSVDVSCLLWVAPFSSLLTTQQTVQQQFVAEVLPYLLVYCGCGLGPEGAQHLELVEGLHAEVADTEAALAQLQQERLSHADLLATYTDQVAALQVQRVGDSSPLATSASTQLEQLNEAWNHRETTTASLRDRAEALMAEQTSLVSRVQQMFAVSSNSHIPMTSAATSVGLFQSVLSKLAHSLYGITQAAQQLPSVQQPPASSPAHWNGTVFLVKTVLSTVSSCLNNSVNLTSQNEMGLTAQAAQQRAADNILQSFMKSVDEWNQAMLLPSLLDQLQAAAASGVSTAEQERQGMTKGADDDLLHSMTHLALEDSGSPAGAMTGNEPSISERLQGSVPELVPFSDFDDGLDGADQTLESGLEEESLEQQADLSDAGLELELGSDYLVDASKTEPAGLVPFSDFDANLAGAGQSLELADNSLEGHSLISKSHDSSSSNSRNSDGVGDHAKQPSSSQGQRLSHTMTDFVYCSGALASAAQQEAAMAAAQCDVQSRADSKGGVEQLVAFEWVHEAELKQALQGQGSLGPPALVSPKDPQAVPKWSLSIRRSQVVNALGSALSILAGVEEAWAAWRHASSQTEKSLRRLFRTSHQQYNVHDQLFAARQQWLDRCDDIAGWTERLAQNVLQLERSREGLVWSRSAGADDKSFAECGALLQQRQYLCSALKSAEEEVAMAQLTLPELHKQASAAAAQLQPAQVEERQLGQGFAQQAPSLLQLAEALLQPVRECQRAAHGALPAMHQTQAALREVLDDSEKSSGASAIRESLQEAHDRLVKVQQHSLALDESLSAVAAAVELNLQAGSQQQLSQSPVSKPVKGFSKSKRAALVLDAMKPILAAAVDQARSPDLTDQTVSQLADAVVRLPEQAKAVATSIQQAYQAQGAVAAVTLPLVSEVADAQPPVSEASASIPQAASAASHHTSSPTESQHSDLDSDTTALVGTAGDDLEQDTKAVLKAGGQGNLLKGSVRDGLDQKADGESQKAQRNAFAAATLSAFQNKLSGRAALGEQGLDVEQHVDQLIKQATSLDKLSQMYEGWTAWI